MKTRLIPHTIIRNLVVVFLSAFLFLTACGSGQQVSLNLDSPHNGQIITLSSAIDRPYPYGVGDVYSTSTEDIHWNPGYFQATLNSTGGDINDFARNGGWGIKIDGSWFDDCDPNHGCRLNAQGSWTQQLWWEPDSLGIHSMELLGSYYTGSDLFGDHYAYSQPIDITVCVINDPLHPVPNIPVRQLNLPSGLSSPFTCNVPPTVTPTPIPIIDSVQAYPNPIYYGNTCPTISTVTFRAALTLPPGVTADQVTVQSHVRVVIGSLSTDSGSFLVNLLPNGSWDATTGGQVFLGTLDLSHRYNDANNHFDPASLGGSPGALLWYVDVSRSGTLLGRSGNQVLDLSPCPIPGHNPPPHNGGGSPSSPSGICGQYTNATSCNLAGCSWNGTSCGVTQ
ncbi:MAG TPA: hypothetical protein VLX61_14055 [Anaerolineales bacterium]|nr:hypothetical protein [Anaerolineales bacterium]